MRKILLFLILAGYLWPAPVRAMQFLAEENVFFGPAESVEADLYLAGENVTFLGLAQQDIFGAASSLATISGRVAQDLNLAAMKVEITAQVGDDVRILAKQLTLDGRVGGSALLLASQVNCQRPSICEQDVVILAKDVRLSGTINGSLRVIAKRIVIDGVVAGNVILRAEKITLGPAARILGTLRYQSPQQITVQPGAVLQRPAQRIQEQEAGPPGEREFNFKGMVLVGKILYRVTLFLGLVAVGCLLLVMAPVASRRYVLVLRHRPWASLSWGALTSVGIVVLFFILLVSLIGIPLAVVLAIFSVLAMLLAGLGVGYLLGFLLLKPGPAALGRNIAAFILGFTLLGLIGLIPVLGELIEVIVILGGLGALWLVKGFVEPKASLPAPAPMAARSEKPTEPQPTPAAPVPSQTSSVSREKSLSWEPTVPAFKRKKPVRAALPKKKTAQRRPAPKKTRVGTGKKTVKRAKPKK